MRYPLVLAALTAAPVLGASTSAEWRDGQLSITTQRGGRNVTLVRGVAYRAEDEAGLAFETLRAVPGEGGAMRFDLAGPAAAAARVTVRIEPVPSGVGLEWTIRYNGPHRQWNGWTSRFEFDFGAEVTGVATRPVTRWVRPTGKHPWEVRGDTLYPDTECQLREVVFGDSALVMVAEDYDPDWIYGGNEDRARHWRLAPPVPPETEVRCRMVLLAIPANDRNPARLAAMAAGRPLALSVGTGRAGNLFAPGERVPLVLELSNVSGSRQNGRLDITAHDYYGRMLLRDRVPLSMAPNERRRMVRVVRPPARGVVFVDTLLSWSTGHQPGRTTVGVLPQRAAGGTRPDSPFGLAAVIASPHRYPDQWDLETVLRQAERIGVRWLRGGWIPLQDTMTDQELAAARSRLSALKRHGILPHTQMAASVPPPDEVQALKSRLATSLQRLPEAGEYIEVGNELNYSATAPEYVERLLRPVHDVMREVRPDAKIMTMGLGGVMRDWLAAFVAAGGLDLADVLSIHPGCHPRAPEFWEDWRGWVFRPQVQDALAAARDHGARELWITEAYAPVNHFRSSVDLRTAADYLVRTYVCAIALGVKVTEWYQLQDGVWFAQRQYPADGEYNYGMLYVDLTPKPQYVAFGTMTEQLEGAAYVGRLDLGADDLYGVRFQRDGETVDVMWSYREKHETDLGWWPPELFADDSRRPGEPWHERWLMPVAVKLPASGSVEVTDLMGNRRSLQAQEGAVTLELTGSPVYVRGLAAAPLRAVFWEELP